MFMKTEEYLVDLHRPSTKEDPVDVGFKMSTFLKSISVWFPWTRTNSLVMRMANPSVDA